GAEALTITKSRVVGLAVLAAAAMIGVAWRGAAGQNTFSTSSVLCGEPASMLGLAGNFTIWWKSRDGMCHNFNADDDVISIFCPPGKIPDLDLKLCSDIRSTAGTGTTR
ncbi:MAG TPA: hypothetical protein VMR62_22025, partial [Bryobacteraceae bacterium]|nr:hypothetical protein [Bryobacteraceae bacterium]